MGTTDVHAMRALVLRGALKLECLGMTRRGRSAYAITKDTYGFRGNKHKVLTQLEKFIAENFPCSSHPPASESAQPTPELQSAPAAAVPETK